MKTMWRHALERVLEVNVGDRELSSSSQSHVSRITRQRTQQGAVVQNFKQRTWSTHAQDEMVVMDLMAHTDT